MPLTREVKPGAWEVWLDDRKVGSAASRRAAIKQVERLYRPGFAQVINIKTGEAWDRRKGSWFKSLDAGGRRGEAVADSG